MMCLEGKGLKLQHVVSMAKKSLIGTSKWTVEKQQYTLFCGRNQCPSQNVLFCETENKILHMTEQHFPNYINIMRTGLNQIPLKWSIFQESHIKIKLLAQVIFVSDSIPILLKFFMKHQQRICGKQEIVLYCNLNYYRFCKHSQFCSNPRKAGPFFIYSPVFPWSVMQIGFLVGD